MARIDGTNPVAMIAACPASHEKKNLIPLPKCRNMHLGASEPPKDECERTALVLKDA